MWTGVMIRQYNTLSISTEQVFGYSEKGQRLRFVGFAVVLFIFAVGAYSTEEDTHVHDHGNHVPWLTLPGLIKPAGIATLSCLVLTVAAALLRRKKPKFLLEWHKRVGIATLVLAVIHLILVLIAH